MLLSDISVKDYQSHWLHAGDTLWPQSNCYVDLWVEILHSFQLNPVASFAFTLASDFEGDQWTFFKVPLHDLFLLYGIDVQELLLWQSLPQQILTQTLRNRLVLVELDAFYLPDVSDTSYHREHEKTTVGVQWIDLEAREMHYFHNSGLHALRGDDFSGIFRLTASPDEIVLPPYIEYAKLDHLKRLSDADLASLATELMNAHLQRLPAANPFIAYRQSFEQYLATLSAHDLAFFHQYAFATMRQFGACYEYASLFLKWLSAYRGDHLLQAAHEFEEIASGAQVLLMKTARTVRTQKPFDFSAFIDPMESHWHKAMEYITSR